jgi:RNA polymerase sigma factor (sigma-70 family)
MRRAARGDREAFAAIFSRHQQDLYRYCVAILGDPDDAQDALQNTMVKALRSLPGERREIALKPWLFRIAHNEAIELRRSERPTEPLADVKLPAGASLEQIAAERGRLRELLVDLAALPVRQRGALVMRELAGLDFDQIGAALETTPAAARQVLYEARRGLHEMAEGREMRCDAVTAILSDGDGRVARRRDVRAHLRDCPECRAFAAEIQSRGETLAAIAPLPALAAAALAKGALAGSAGSVVGGAVVGGGAAGGGAAGAGLAAGVAATTGSTAALIKSAAAVVAIVAVGAVAADRTHLVHLGGSGGEAPAARGAGAGGQDGSSSDVAARASHRLPLRASEAGAAVGGRHGLTDAHSGGRSGRSVIDPTAAKGGADLVGSPAKTAAVATGEAGRPLRAADHSAGATGAVHPAHPTYPTHPVHPVQPIHPPHPAKPATPETSAAPAKPPKEPKTEVAAAAEQPPVEPAATTVEAGRPSEAAPGQVRKATGEEEPAG